MRVGGHQLQRKSLSYMTSPEYLQTYAQHFVQLGARSVGGCCGTGAAHIKALAQSIKAMHADHVELRDVTRDGPDLVEPPPIAQRSRFGNRLASGQWVTSVELVPPLGWSLKKTVEKATRCYQQRVDAINIPDGPRASARLSPMVTACTIQQEVGIEVILHLTCRDKNVIGMQSDLLGCAAAQVNNILIVTGDPPKLGDYPFATAVFDLDSIGLLKVASRLNQGMDVGGVQVKPATRLLLGCGADPSHLDQEREISRLEQKVAAGANFVTTQPIYEPEVLLAFIKRIKHLGLPVIAGIWPLASLRNADFLNNEVPGVHVPSHIIERMRMASEHGKEAARAEGIAIAREIIDQLRPHVAGVQVSAPFGNVDTALKVIRDIP